MITTLLTFLAASPAVLATVTVDNPLDGQLPLIARVGVNYTWSFSPLTFSTDFSDSLSYTASGLPSWCSFDSETQTLQGVPSGKDVGSLQINISASDSESSATSSFFLPVTSDPPPTLQVPLQTQFFAGSPSLSSVFFLSPGSALKTDNFVFRIPPHWSFSVGILDDTFLAQSDVYYAALQADGTPLPDWVTFDTNTTTFDGTSPYEAALPTPYTLSIDVHASDQPGYSAETVSFDIIVASHELYALSTLPTVNVTADSPFNFSVTAAADFTGILIDGQPLQPDNITDLSIDVSSYKNWLQYDNESRTLFGIPPAGLSATDATHGGPVLPAKLTTDFNQTLETTMSLAVVSSYFSASDLGVVNADPGQQVHFDLTQFFSNKADTAQNHNDVNLSLTFFPDAASDYLSFDPASAQLSGQVPGNSQLPKIDVTFIAYSQVTHSTSHATLSVVSPQVEAQIQGLAGLAARQTTTTILSIVFGTIGGLSCLGAAVALYRRRTRVRDPAALAEEGALPRSDEKKYHGTPANGSNALRQVSKDDNWSKEANMSATGEKGGLRNPSGTPSNWSENLGLGLPHAVPRTSSTAHADTHKVTRKGELLERIKEAVRNASDKCMSKAAPTRPVIGYPAPLTPRRGVDELPLEGHYVDIRASPDLQYTLDNPYSDTELRVKRASTIASLVGSPSNSTDDRSIPRRRADFGPPRSLRGPRELAPTAVKDAACRSPVRESTLSASTISYESLPQTIRIIQTAAETPRLKQFAYVSPVPPPRSQSSNQTTLDASQGTKRIISQTANVYRGRHAHHATDSLSIGMHYVRTLGEGPSHVHSMSNETFSSLASPPGRGAVGVTKESRVSRFVVRTGERFKFRIPVTSVNGVLPKLEARLTSGQALPRFLQLELKEYDDVRRVVEFSGIPTEDDVGEIHAGVFDEEGGVCLAKVVVEIKAPRR
ncbi:hypothetical protein K503DRAFT_865545 [Rhizopogon vinicolor AM-OR11-026]|uniref:Dystroglycan-type cadherin-like domain-containing protein n=1 Tax=Rhizopogon vinicolor AM-OR11-026 TaxID=1314800 RepID=A0A1B7N355_9AGAM|nr:hypothetical protein K503DRAFT_865545 [Rhizopogon vinicolor AM-OR11-026]